MNTDKIARKSIVFAILLIGATAMSAQIVLLRQLIVVFYGNELSLGLLLAAWLFWSAAGSWWLGRCADQIKKRILLFAVLQIVLALCLVATILLIRNAARILGTFPGEIIGLVPMAAFTFCCLSLICIILGFLFALACRIYPTSESERGVNPTSESERGAYPAKQSGAVQIGRVYLWEALGAGLGGLLVSFFFIRRFDGLYIIFGLAGLNLVSAYLLQQRLKITKLLMLTKAGNLVLIFLLLSLLFSQQAFRLKQASIVKQWKDFNLLAAEDSIYSNLVVTKRDSQYSFFSNGLYLYTVPDQQASEEAVHFALLETVNPQRVLLIGGGMGGLAQEVLKHPVLSLDYVELDPQIIELGKRLLPAPRLAFLTDSRVSVFHQDGRSFIRRSAAEHYQSVILYLGDPYTAQINRFYTREFFQQVKKVLTPEGVFSFGLGSSENFLNPEQEQFLGSIYKTLSSVFADVKVIPGDTAYFLATDKQGILTYDYQQLLRRLQQRGINTRFVRLYYLFAKFAPDRIQYLEQRIRPKPQTQLNTDFRPISYYYDMLLWSTYFARPWRALFAQVNQKTLGLFFVLVYLFVLAFGFWRRRKKAFKSSCVLLTVSTTGLTELSFQVVILLAFQIIYGYLYYKLGIILSLFMLGLVWGSWSITRKLNTIKDDYGLLIKTQIAIAFYPLILPLIFLALNQASASLTFSWLGSNIVFPLLPVISGFVGGFQFPLANSIVLKEGKRLGRVAGLTYGMDLLGSCLGALLVSAFLVPLLGLTQTCFAIAILNCIVLITLIINRR